MRSIFIPKLRLRLILVAAVVALMAMACGGGEAPATSVPKPTIRFVDTSYESAWIANALAKFIIEKGYGYPVESLEVTVPVAQVSLARGDIDVWLDLWYWYYGSWYEPAIADGKIENVGVSMEPAPSFWTIPKWVAEEYNIKSVEDMKRPEVIKLFPDPEDPSKGLFVNCPIGWECQLINTIKLEGYGLTKYYNIAEASAGALEAQLAGAQIKHQPVFGYYWAPTALMGMYDWYILEEPKYDPDIWSKIMAAADDESLRPLDEAVAYEAVSPINGIWSGLRDKAPDVVPLLGKMNVGLEPVNKIAAWAKENEIGGDWNKAAIQYLKTYEDRWTTWMPADKVEKVKAALEKAGA